jgi:hypothetical protein
MFHSEALELITWLEHCEQPTHQSLPKVHCRCLEYVDQLDPATIVIRGARIDLDAWLIVV